MFNQYQLIIDPASSQLSTDAAAPYLLSIELSRNTALTSRLNNNQQDSVRRFDTSFGGEEMSATIPTARARTAVITGASSGIGHACVLRMVNAGWRVFATVRKTQDGDRLQSEIGAAVTPVIMDLQNEGSIRVAADQVSGQVDGRGIDGLVNVAGIGMVRPVEYVKPEICRKYSTSTSSARSPSRRHSFR